MARHSHATRCDGCGLLAGRCICSELPRVRLPFRLLVVRHWKEALKPTNTARLLAKVVEPCTLEALGRPDAPWRAERLGAAGERRLVLFPGPESTMVERAQLAAWLSAPLCFVLLDGSWRQAARMVRRAAGIAELPRVMLPAGPPSRWPIRRAARLDQLCTFETVVRLATLLPDHAAATELERAYQLILAAQTDQRSGFARGANPIRPCG